MAQLIMKTRITSGFFATALLCSAPLCFADDPISQTPDVDSLDALQAFIEVYEQIKLEYVEEIDDQTLLNHAIDGMLSKLDPHSGYLEPRDVSDLRDSTSGSFGGIGIEMDVVNGLIEVISPIDDSPAARAGVKPKDIIVQVDGENVRDITLREAIELLRGPIGESVELGILREEDGRATELTVSLERAVIRVTSVQHDRLPNDIGYLRIAQFQSRTGADLIKAITQLESEAPLAGLILDLRNNPGGVLSAAIDVADAFLTGGIIVSTRGRDEFANIEYEANAETALPEPPMVVLINGGSASAAEIVAGALADHDRAVLIGTPTFGKGSVQTIASLENNYALKLTTALYYTPSGRSIQATGIQPTIQVSEGDAVIESDLRTREADLPKHLENNMTVEEMDALEDRLTADNQLLHAYNLLRGAQLLNR